MQSAVETLSPTRVRLTVEVPFAELKPELDKAYKTIGAQVKVQGFRPGKVPQRILDQRVGRGVVLEEAVQEALPRLYSEAVTESGVAPVGRPEVDVTKLDDGVELAFTAEVDVRPEFEIPAYDGLAVTVADAVVSDDDISTQVDELRERFAKLTPVERPAAEGDYVTLDLAATVDGKEVPGGTATGLSYQVGSGDLLDGLDEAVTGASAEEAKTFTTTLVAGDYEGQQAEVAVTVRAVNERELPAADDAWAETTGFASFEELQADVRTRLDRVKKMEQGVEARDKVLEALLAAVEVPLPESVVEAEIEWRRESTTTQLQQAGLTLDQYLEDEGKGEEEFAEEVRESATTAVKAQLVLDAVADAEQLGVTDAELTDQVVRRAQRAGVSPDQYAQSLVQSGSLQALVAEVRRGKALATVMEGASITDASGQPVDLEALRDDLDPGMDDTQIDESGRPFHTHGDGTVHYLDEG
ncbi:MAG: trigger factor [Frankiales bacterium]|nr:trigger factor [Frankiales bacterium]